MLPSDFGFSMPHEGAAHTATWACWPFDDAEWRGQLEGARQEFAALVGRIARSEPVRLLVADAESMNDAQLRLPSEAAVSYLRVELDDVWFRDHGPTFVVAKGEVAPICWCFNAWGEKFDFALDALAAREVCRREGWSYFDSQCVLEGGALESDGAGHLLTTRSCLFHPRRNPGTTQADYERLFADYLGAKRVTWLEAGLEGDHTDGHIDTITRFIKPNQVVTCVASRKDPNYAQLERNRQALHSAGLEVLDLPIPSLARVFHGQRLPETYANFYLVNGAVLVPQYGDPHDALALEILAAAFPERSVEGLDSRSIITSGGSFHCLTQQQPQGRAWQPR
jgi:agmatine deiminase